MGLLALTLKVEEPKKGWVRISDNEGNLLARIKMVQIKGKQCRVLFESDREEIQIEREERLIKQGKLECH